MYPIIREPNIMREIVYTFELPVNETRGMRVSFDIA